MLGLVLAAGDATRMPNKPLLPIKDGLIAIESSVHFCKARCERTIVMTSPQSIIPQVITMRGGPTLCYIEQPEPNGVLDAIYRAHPMLEVLGETRLLVTFCDNVYDQEEEVESLCGGSIASCRQLNKRPGLNQLDRCERRAKKIWTLRSDNTDLSTTFFAGWMVLRASDILLMPRYDTLLSFMNDHVSPHLVKSTNWHDIGTPETYEWYLRS